MTLYQGDCLEVMPRLADNSIDLIAVDPPYFRVKDDQWDRQWPDHAAFVAWIGRLCQEFRRVLKPNGSVYLFASPRMAAAVEMEVARRFSVLNHIVWLKPPGREMKARKEDLRCYFPVSERIIFAQQYGADGAADGVAGYSSACERLRADVFEPLRAYFDGERQRAGVSPRQIMEYFAAHGWPKYVTARHTFTRSQWELPTAQNYERLRQALHALADGGEYLRREYEGLRREYEGLRREYEGLRREYEGLRREYEGLRRPFAVTVETPHTDVWQFRSLGSGCRERVHPTQKPLEMMRHIVRASSRPGDVVLDCCMGSGTTGVAAVMEGRRFIGVELDAGYCEIARRRIESVQPALLDTTSFAEQPALGMAE